MSSVGGVGAAPAVSGAAPAVSGGQAEASLASRPDVSSDTTTHMSCHGSNMSTQSFVELLNTALTQVNESQCSEVNLEKLIEMMIAIELLKTMSEQ